MERKWPDLTVLSVVTRIIGPRCGEANKLTCTDTTTLTHPSPGVLLIQNSRFTTPFIPLISCSYHDTHHFTLYRRISFSR